MTVLERARLSPRGPGIHRTAKCKVYGSIQNITRLSTQHTWLARSTNSWSLNSRRRANHAIRATTAFDSDACSRTSHHCSVRSSRTTQGLFSQACASHAYSANASCWKMEQMLARSWRMPPCDKIAAPEPPHARSSLSRPPHAAQRWPASRHCAEAAAVPR